MLKGQMEFSNAKKGDEARIKLRQPARYREKLRRPQRIKIGAVDTEFLMPIDFLWIRIEEDVPGVVAPAITMS